MHSQPASSCDNQHNHNRPNKQTRKQPSTQKTKPQKKLCLSKHPQQQLNKKQNNKPTPYTKASTKHTKPTKPAKMHVVLFSFVAVE